MFDHFHVIKLFNEKLTKLRRDLQREAEAGLGKPVLKGIRWLLLKNPDNLQACRYRGLTSFASLSMAVSAC